MTAEMRQQNGGDQSPNRRPGARTRVLYVINSQPLITVGPGSYIHQMIGLAGGTNIAAAAATAYPRSNDETVLKERSEILIFLTGSVETVPRSEQEALATLDHADSRA